MASAEINLNSTKPSMPHEDIEHYIKTCPSYQVLLSIWRGEYLTLRCDEDLNFTKTYITG
jgi:hypothetical protein